MLPAFIFVLGLIFGSFLNAVIFRLKAGEQFLSGHSRCPQCNHQLNFWDLIPLFSFVFLKAKCRYCQVKISWQYPLVELATGLIFVLGYNHFQISNFQFSIFNQFLIPNFQLLNYFVYLIFSCFLIIIFVYDFKYYLILDKVSLTALISAVILNFFLGKPIGNLLIGALVIAGFFLLQFIVSRGRWIGGGDLRLGLVMGAMLGWPQVLTALFLAYIIGATAGLVLIILKKKRWNSQLPFGTFLSASTWITLLWGPQIIQWYYSLF